LALMLIGSTWSALLLGKLSAARLRYITNLNEDNERLLNELSEERKIVNAERDRAEQAVIKNSHFMAVASHDLRQPLHAIGLYHHELKNMDKTRDPSEYYESIERSMDALNKMFDSLLDISQLDAKAVVPHFQAMDSNVAFEAFVEEARTAAAQKNLILETDLQNSVINTDPLLLGRIIRNLLGNAIKFTNNGVILLRTSHTKSGLRVDIADSGVGISTSDKVKIFDEFYQVKQNAGRQNGVGLGLSIVDRLCQLLDITLSVESNQPAGSVFTLHIPLSDSQPYVEANDLYRVTNELENLIVLFIDDDEDISAAMELLLKRLGCHCLRFSDPAGVSELIMDEGIIPDLLICDYQLNSQLTGLDIIEQTRNNIDNKLPALIVSGEVSGDLAIQCREAGVPLIAKPVSPDVLKHAILNLLSSKH